MEQAAAVLLEGGIQVKLAPTPGPSMAADLAREAARDTSSLVIACGGDGTINEVINGMVPGSTPLGILPGGTANITAKELGLPHDPVRAARELLNWRPRRIALGRASWPTEQGSNEGGAARSAGVQQRYFLSVAGVGFDAYVVYRLALDFKVSLGVVAYAIEALRQTFRHSFPPITCRLDGQKLEGTLAVIQRTQLYAGWFHLAPAASLFEPKLNLCLFTSRSRWRYFAYIAAVVARLHPRLRDVTMMDATRIHCAALAPDTPIHFEVDGELGGTLPATFEVVPDALTLLAPATSTAAGQPGDS
jgi:diacylglycerol kinase (ATP)